MDSGAIVIDFMSVIRKLSSVELKDVTTFGDLCHALLHCVSSYTGKRTVVHLILKNYTVISPKYIMYIFKLLYILTYCIIVWY